MRGLQRQVEAFAAGDDPMLIQGEPGAGKELIARLVHFRSGRRDAPLLRADCAQIAETPWGDKLFGDYRGGPDDHGQPPSVSYLDLAGGGTIVLKDVDTLPRAIQERLAAFVARPAAGAARRGARDRHVPAQDLGGLAAGQRVSPALAQVFAAADASGPAAARPTSATSPALASHFVAKHAARLNKPVPTLDDQAVSKLITYDYRIGNVRELEEAIHRAVILTDGARIDAEAIFLGQPPAPSRWAFNVLTLRGPVVQLALRLFPRAVQVLAAAVFAFILFGCWFAPDTAAARGPRCWCGRSGGRAGRCPSSSSAARGAPSVRCRRPASIAQRLLPLQLAHSRVAEAPRPDGRDGRLLSDRLGGRGDRDATLARAARGCCC